MGLPVVEEVEGGEEEEVVVVERSWRWANVHGRYDRLSEALRAACRRFAWWR